MTVSIKKPLGYKPLLTVQNAKTIKGEQLGYLTGILYLAPANEAGRGNLCPKATDCEKVCLFTAGRGAFKEIRAARIAKTHRLFDDRELFLACLRYDVAALVRRAKKLGLTPAIRINGTSDLALLALRMADEFPEVQFYDYTKLSKPWLRVRSNYHLTFSYSGKNTLDCIDALAHGVNVSAVFNVKKGSDLPATFLGRTVIDGDLHDLRFLDSEGVIVGLRAKGMAKKVASNFVVNALTILQ